MYYTPLRYPGGKGRLAQHVIDLMEMNDLAGAHYVEPYAGGAGIAISLLYLEYADHIHLNDLDLAVYSFWRSIIDRTEDFLRLIRDTPLTVEEWRKQRALQYAKEGADLLGYYKVVAIYHDLDTIVLTLRCPSKTKSLLTIVGIECPNWFYVVVRYDPPLLNVLHLAGNACMIVVFIAGVIEATTVVIVWWI